MKKRVLIAYATYGSGHKMVAEYLYNYFKEKNNPNLDIKIINIMDYGNKLGDLSVNLFMKNFQYRCNFLWNMIYELSDHRITTFNYKFITRSLFTKKLEEEIVEYNPDILISSHFFASIMMDLIKGKYDLKTKVVTILTDYISHKFWLKNKNKVDAYIVSNEIVKRQLIKDNIKPSIIHAYGIPLSNKFKNVICNKDDVRKFYKINNDKPIYLFFAGGSYGPNFSYDYLEAILSLKLDINLIFVAGKNERLKNRVDYLVKKEDYKNVIVLGFTNDVERLMSIANLIITKPGALILTEALEMKRPLLLIPGNGGQENYNAKFIKKNGFGVYCNTIRKLKKTFNRLYNNDNLITTFKDNLLSYHENDSIKEIYKLVIDLLKE